MKKFVGRKLCPARCIAPGDKIKVYLVTYTGEYYATLLSAPSWEPSKRDKCLIRVNMMLPGAFECSIWKKSMIVIR